MNKVIIIGRLGQDPKFEYTAAGTAVCTLSVATSEKFKEKEVTQWHRVVVFGKIGENCNHYLKKGSQLYVEGSLKTRSWDDNNFKKYITEIIAREVTFLDSKPQAEKPAPEPMDPEFYTEENVKWAQDEIPF